jgi:ribonuclease HI
VILTLFWLKHSLFKSFRSGRSQASTGRRRRREHIYVDASYKEIEGQSGVEGIGGIGVWMPDRGLAIALQVNAGSSMEAEILALLAGTIAARQLGAERPVIFSDCKSAVRTAVHHLQVERIHGWRRQLLRLAALSSEHRAFRHIYNALQGLGGSLEWRPREDNREADLASNIGSRLGHMGIQLSGAKNRNHALNDVLSLATAPDEEVKRNVVVHRKYRGGTRTVSLAARRTTTSRGFLREGHGLIAKLSQAVA